MSSIPVIAIFDIGRTNKKFILFDKEYRIAEERSLAIPDVKDEDGFPCEDLVKISDWVKRQLNDVLQDKRFDIKALNFSTHGASIAHLDHNDQLVTPLYDYLKPLPGSISDGFYQMFGNKDSFSIQTGSPVLNMLNSGIQLYWLKQDKPEYFSKVKTSLHLPQYFNFLFSKIKHADITSIGCHTGLWDFKQKQYHSWLRKEEVLSLLPAAESIRTSDQVHVGGKDIATGIGIHDSSAALLPFVYTADDPFVMLSSGTWNITMNPFFKGELDDEHFEKDCLYYLLGVGHKVGSSRLFLGNELEYQIKRLEEHFEKKEGYHSTVIPDEEMLSHILKIQSGKDVFYPQTMHRTGPFPYLKEPPVNLDSFPSFEYGYHKLMLDLVFMQKTSIDLVCQKVKNLYISGGFIHNKLFMELLQAFLNGWKIYITDNKHASSLGAAVAMHDVWQTEPLYRILKPVKIFTPQYNFKVNQYINFFN